MAVLKVGKRYLPKCKNSKIVDRKYKNILKKIIKEIFMKSIKFLLIFLLLIFSFTLFSETFF